MSPATLAIRAPRAFIASQYQKAFFDWVATGSGNAILKAVAGSGKSTSIVRALTGIPIAQTVLILAFNTPIAKEMRDKIAALEAELGEPGRFRSVEAATFHSRGFRALTRRFGAGGPKIEVDGGKVRKILKDRLSAGEVEMYGDFVCKLVGFAKGLGVGIPGLATDDISTWRDMIATQELWLDDEMATEERAIDIARKALAASNRKAETDRWIDFDDQLYLPLLWSLRLFQHDWVLVDEAQDTNPVRREFARKCLKPSGRFVAVGDPRQAIYAFTGASANAMDLIAQEFKTTELPLTVSYRCPKVAVDLVKTIVPYFEVADGAPLGKVQYLPAKGTKTTQGAFDGLGAHDMVLCRQTAPLISLAFALIAEGRGVFVVGKDIGAGLTALIKRLRPHGVPNLIERLDGWLAKEEADAKKTDKPAKFEAAADRVACVKTVIDSLPDNRTVPDVLAKIESLFADGTGAGLLPLSTIHKAKGREANIVAVYRPDLSPSKAAKSPEAFEQEMNLCYVRDTRFKVEMRFADGDYR